MLKQKAVWWSHGAQDQYGDRTFADPVEIKCRWEARTGEYFNARGESNTSKATVYVDREMKVGDVLKLGELESETPDDPSEDSEALTIQGFDDIPDLKAKKHLYRAHL